MLNAMCFTPNRSATFPASPASTIVGRPPLSRTTSTSTHRTPRDQPVPSAFIAASFAANRPAYLSYLFLKRSQYSLSRAVNSRLRNVSPYRSIAACTRPTSAMSTPNPTINLPPVAQALLFTLRYEGPVPSITLETNAPRCGTSPPCYKIVTLRLQRFLLGRSKIPAPA